MLRRIWIAATMFLAACSATAAPQASDHAGAEGIAPPEPAEASPSDIVTPVETSIVRADLEDYGPAPELENEVWLNTNEPLRLENLRGKVVLLDMWTFG